MKSEAALIVKTPKNCSKCESKPTVRNSKKCRLLQNALDGGRECEFEPFAKNGEFEAEVRDVNIKNTKTRKNKTATKENPEPAKKYSNHIEFVDYIPTHEVITYRHLFAYGFYVV